MNKTKKILALLCLYVAFSTLTNQIAPVRAGTTPIWDDLLTVESDVDGSVVIAEPPVNVFDSGDYEAYLDGDVSEGDIDSNLVVDNDRFNDPPPLPYDDMGYNAIEYGSEIERQQFQMIDITKTEKSDYSVNVDGIILTEISPNGHYYLNETDMIFQSKAYYTATLDFADLDSFTSNIQTVTNELTYLTIDDVSEWDNVDIYDCKYSELDGSIELNYFEGEIKVFTDWDVNVNTTSFWLGDIELSNFSIAGDVVEITIIGSELHEEITTIELSNPVIYNDQVKDYDNSFQIDEMVEFANLGIHEDDSISEFYQTLSQGEHYIPQGVMFYRGDHFVTKMILKPDVKQSIDALELNYQAMRIKDYNWNFLDDMSGVDPSLSFLLPRTRSVQIKEYNPTLTVKIEVNLYSTVKINKFEESNLTFQQFWSALNIKNVETPFTPISIGIMSGLGIAVIIGMFYRTKILKHKRGN
jgi:hypothetical protein